MSVEDEITRERVLAEYSLIAFGGEVEMQYKIKALQDLSKYLKFFEEDEEVSGMTKSWDELEEIHQELMAEMREDEKRYADRGIKIELAIAQGLDIDDWEKIELPD